MPKIRAVFIAMVALASGLCGALAASCLAAQPAAALPAQASEKESGAEHDIYGTIRSIEGSVLSIETRSKTLVRVDIRPAVERQRSHVPAVGRSVEVRGTYDKKGVLQATAAQRAQDSQLLWPADK